MIWLVLGVLLWSGVHAFPGLGASMRAAWIEKLGEDKYKAGFALALVVAVVLMVLGWRGTAPVSVYTPPLWGRTAAIVLMGLGLVLFVASGVPTNIKRFLRHPQLSGMAVWSVAHLFANGDSRSLVLFGGLGLWAVLEMRILDRRDGAWEKPDARPLRAELTPLIAAAVAFALLFFAHPYIAGVPILAR